MPNLTIDVTQEDIDKGERGDLCMCPVALAMLRAGLEAPMVGDARLAFISERLWYQKVTPVVVTNFVYEFDQFGRGAVAPFSFTLEF